MEDGNKSKKTIFVGGIADDADESILYETFSTFGDIIEVQIPVAVNNSRTDKDKHRGFAFVTFGSAADAADAIDNMDMNEMQGKVLKVNIARPSKATLEGAGNRAVWESEAWLKENARPLAQSGGVQSRTAQSNAMDESETGGDQQQDGDDMEE